MYNNGHQNEFAVDFNQKDEYSRIMENWGVSPIPSINFNEVQVSTTEPLLSHPPRKNGASTNCFILHMPYTYSGIPTFYGMPVSYPRFNPTFLFQQNQALLETQVLSQRPRANNRSQRPRTNNNLSQRPRKRKPKIKPKSKSRNDKAELAFTALFNDPRVNRQEKIRFLLKSRNYRIQTKLAKENYLGSSIKETCIAGYMRRVENKIEGMKEVFSSRCRALIKQLSGFRSDYVRYYVYNHNDKATACMDIIIARNADAKLQLVKLLRTDKNLFAELKQFDKKSDAEPKVNGADHLRKLLIEQIDNRLNPQYRRKVKLKRRSSSRPLSQHNANIPSGRSQTKLRFFCDTSAARSANQETRNIQSSYFGKRKRHLFSEYDQRTLPLKKRDYPFRRYENPEFDENQKSPKRLKY